MRVCLLVFFCLLLKINAASKVRLAGVFGDHMVLQQQTKIVIWGWAEPGSVVSVKPSWNWQENSIRAGSDGRWRLPVLTPTAGGPYTMVISDGSALTILDILIGEVWICSGQSNMTMPVKGFPDNPVKDSAAEIEHAKNDKIRLFDVGRSALLGTQDDVKGSWKEVSSATVANFSATAWFFGKTLQEKLGIPVGLITTSWGGSTIETWMSEKALSAFQSVKIPKTADSIKLPQQTPTILFNNMLYPLIGYRIKGAIWYQGESNRNNPVQYPLLFESMVKDWRLRWGIGDFPFYYLQIAPFSYFPKGGKGLSSAYIREAQMKAEDRVPNTGMAILMDVGEEKMIHPGDKKSAGTRLAYLALSRSYGMKEISDTGPIYKAMTIRGNSAFLTFKHAEEGLTSNGKELRLFEIAGADRLFFPAQATITDKGVKVRSSMVKKPVAVRYAFMDFVIGDLFNSSGFPASSFRTDDWPVTN
ncbi:sialate O-acetylesterase [Pedobacter africanus]|uniref:Sialate O-acetylesterase n=1 Tax=Pedobacter africanus TaxID=151894 RepID=A0A1W1Z8I9_9SPHI|nr:sialate O-acetylesterase [Pedobacter africanus]SMC44750.1 sialate O-acetylesterase [Pedobacter africanus]